MLSAINLGIHEPVVLTQFELFVLGGGHGSVDSQQPQHHVHRRRHQKTDRWAPSPTTPKTARFEDRCARLLSAARGKRKFTGFESQNCRY